MTEDSSALPRGRLWQPLTGRWFGAIFGFSLGYAVLRYHLAGDVAWEHFPLFILNKATSLAAVIFVACSYLIGRVIKWHNHDPVMRLVVIKFCGLMGFFLAGMHAFFSFCLLRPAYFGKYFAADGRLNAIGEIGPLAAELGVAIALEPMHAGCAKGWTFLTDLEDTLALLDECDTPQAKLALDTYHLCQDGVPAERLAEIVPRIAVVQ